MLSFDRRAFTKLIPSAVYVGESASLSFLQTVRSAMTAAVGQCVFTSDPLIHLTIESTPFLRFEDARDVSLSLENAQSLADQFFLVASGILDLFDPPWLTAQLPVWTKDASQRSKPKSAIIYLALAIGAQGSACDESDKLVAEQCFAYGRQLAMFNLIDDLSLSTVQAFILITYYMIAACRRNAAFTNLGVAVRAAYTLGIHLHETNDAFVREEGISRERAWKSLRVCDLFLSASMGRPPATSETVCSIPWTSSESISDRDNSSVASQVSSAMFRICNVFERILVEVYSKKTVTLELARSISRQHRLWTEELPRMLKIDGLGDANTAQNCGMSARDGSSVVTMAYYYSIVLLTRPFLSFRVRRSSKKESQKAESSPAKADLITYADACVDSAIKGIDIAHEYIFEKSTPRRQPLVNNSVFISALCLGMAYLDDYDQKRWPLGPSLDHAIAVLTHLAPWSPQAARYAEICRFLKDATALYVEKRDDMFLQSHSQTVREVFGDVRANSKVLSPNLERGSITRTPRSISILTSDDGVVEPISPPFSFQQESMISTSGILPSNLASSFRSHYQDDSSMGDLPQCMTNVVDESLHGDFFDQDVPLFSLTSDLALGTYYWQ
jgi:hypothetical protein